MTRLVFVLSVLIFSRLVQASPMLSSTSVSYSNDTATITSSASLPGRTCCEIWAGSVALHSWYNSSYAFTDETIITQYLQYNNTVVTKTVTQHANTSVSYGIFPGDLGVDPILPGIPTDLILFEDGDYGATAVQQGTVFSNNVTSMLDITFLVTIHTDCV